MVKELNELSELPMKGIVVVDCFANWCGPCKRIAPVFVEISEHFPSFQFVKVNVDEAEDIAGKFSVTALPTFLFLRDGVEIQRFEGADPNAILKICQAIKNNQL